MSVLERVDCKLNFSHDIINTCTNGILLICEGFMVINAVQTLLNVDALVSALCGVITIDLCLAERGRAHKREEFN